jgi:WD40 repeat protein
MRKCLTVLAAAAATVFVAAAPAADAAFPGTNGQIVFVKGNNLWVMNANGGNEHQIAANGSEPAWSPDGRRIAFSWNGNIFTMNANGTGRTQVTTATSVEREPAWTQDGRWILFESNRNDPGGGQNDYGIYKLRSTPPFGTVVPVVPKASFEDALVPDVSGTGRLAYLLDQDDADFGNCCDVVVRTGTTDNAITFALGNRGISWGPASNILAYGSLIPDPNDPEGDIGSHIITIKPNGTGAHALNRPGGTTGYYDESPAYSPDGAWIAFDEEHGAALTQLGIWKMKSDGAGRVRLSATGTDPDWQAVP